MPVEQRLVGWDVGMIQADALGVDQERTLESLKALDAQLPQRLDQEAASSIHKMWPFQWSDAAIP